MEFQRAYEKERPLAEIAERMIVRKRLRAVRREANMTDLFTPMDLSFD